MSAELNRLIENAEPPHPWYRWGPYVSERQWGTVREDYSQDGNAWNYFTHDHARSRAFRWGEDGIGGLSDRHGLLNFTVAVWNGKDPILKERLFGLTNGEGNHGEDVKELYYYLDALPSHAYLKMLYRYPQAEFPYQKLIEENRKRGINGAEYEILETGVFDENAFFDIQIEYAKANTDDILWRVTITNEGAQPAPFHLIPQVTGRMIKKLGGEPNWPNFKKLNENQIEVTSKRYGVRNFYFEETVECVFTNNITNNERIFGTKSDSKYVKDAFHRFIIESETEAVNPAEEGSKLGFIASGTLQPGESRVLRFRFSKESLANPMQTFDEIFAQRIKEADEYYDKILSSKDAESRRVERQVFAGLIWSKQFYQYEVELWQTGDAGDPPPPPNRSKRNASWKHFHAGEVISMPDKWEYPWFAAWDLAFHMVPYSIIDPQFAKDQLLLLLREWYMHPNGQIPAYEWAFSDVNPPVHAWAAHRVFRIDRRIQGKGDYLFLERVFQKLLLNFTWWTNRKDAGENNIFEGGFLGLDNIGVFDRNTPLPNGMLLEQSDGTSWMAMFCLNMLGIALDLAEHNPAYEDVATKFFEHFVYIAHAMHGQGLWDNEDGFYYDIVSIGDQDSFPVKLRSMVGLLPMIASVAVESSQINRLPAFKARMNWFIKHRPDLAEGFAWLSEYSDRPATVFSLVNPPRLKRLLEKMLSEDEFLSTYGIRSISKIYDENPFRLELGGQNFQLKFQPAESDSGMFGGNSNWRGPIWFPVNFLLIESLQRQAFFLGEDWKIEFPTGSGQQLSLDEVAFDISRRLVSIFLPNESGHRPVHEDPRYANDPKWKDLILFFEYFHSENGRGVGASHQTGWTALVAKLIDQLGNYERL